MSRKLATVVCIVFIAGSFMASSIGPFSSSVVAQEPLTPITAFGSSYIGDVFATAHSDLTVKIWDRATSEVIQTVQLPDPRGTEALGPALVQQVSFSPDASKLAASLWGDLPNGLIAIIEASTGQILVEINDIPAVDAIEWSPDGNFIVGSYTYNPLTTGSSHFSYWNAASGLLLEDLWTGESSVQAMTWNPLNSVVSFTQENRIVLWNIIQWEEINSFIADTIAVSSVKWNPSGTILSTVGFEGVVRFWDASTAQLQDEVMLSDFNQNRPSLFWNQSGNVLGILLAHRIDLWDTENDLIAFSVNSDERIVGASFLENGDLIFATNESIHHTQTPFSLSSQARITDGLLALYTFEEGSSTVTDGSDVASNMVRQCAG